MLSDWIKNTRNKILIKSNCDDFVKERTGFALSSATAEPNRVRLEGVGWSVASAILHWFHKDHYPIWSSHARYSVHINKARQTPKRGEWEAYVSFCRKFSKGERGRYANFGQSTLEILRERGSIIRREGEHLPCGETTETGI